MTTKELTEEKKIGEIKDKCLRLTDGVINDDFWGYVFGSLMDYGHENGGLMSHKAFMKAIEIADYITKTTPSHDEKVFAYDEPKYAGWYCQKCPTVIYKASEKDIAEHKCIKITGEIKREALEGLKEKYEHKIKVLGGQAQKVKKYGGNVGNIEGQIRGIKWALHKLYLTEQSLDKGEE